VARIEASASTLAQTVDVFESEIEEDRRYAEQGDHLAAARVAAKMAEKHARDAAEAVVRKSAEAKEAAFVSRLSAAQQAASEGDMTATIEVAKLLAARAEEQEAARAAAAAAYAEILADDEMSANYAVWTGGRDVAERAYKDPNDPAPEESEGMAQKGGQGALGKGGTKGLLLVGSILKFENDLDAEDIRILQVLLPPSYFIAISRSATYSRLTPSTCEYTCRLRPTSAPCRRTRRRHGSRRWRWSGARGARRRAHGARTRARATTRS
jgi:hypothetical protein